MTKHSLKKAVRSLIAAEKRRHFTDQMIGPTVPLDVAEQIKADPFLSRMYRRFSVPESCTCKNPKRHVGGKHA